MRAEGDEVADGRVVASLDVGSHELTALRQADGVEPVVEFWQSSQLSADGPKAVLALISTKRERVRTGPGRWRRRKRWPS